MNEDLFNKSIRIIIPALFLLGILLLSYSVLREFFIIIAWAFIIAYITWQPYLYLKKSLQDKPDLSAAVMTALITTIIILAVFWLLSMLQNEIKTAYQLLQQNLGQADYTLPEALASIPIIGKHLRDGFEQIIAERIDLTQQLLTWAKQGLSELGTFFQHLGSYLIKLGFVLVTVFFCYRDGDSILRQLQQGLIRFLGEYHPVYLKAVGDTTRAVVYGIVLAALAQGITAGLGYAVAGVKAPILFGVVTAVLALIPMGAMVVWISIALVLLANGQIWPGLGLLIWGFLVVSTVDNVVRPLVISGTGKIPFLIVMFGVFGGLSAFGLIGLFLGPVILSVLLSVWQAWLKQHPA